MRFLSALIVALALPLAALAGTTNIPGRLIIQIDDSAPTCSTAASDGTLCVESAAELQSTCAIAGAVTLADALTVAGATTVVYLQSSAADPADSGIIRLGNTEKIAWESDPAGTDRELYVDANEWLTYNGPIRSTTSVGGFITLFDNTDPGTAAGSGFFRMKANSDASNEVVMSEIEMDVTDASDGAEYSDTVFSGMTGGSETEYMRYDASLGILSMSAGLAHHNGTGLPATCTVGQVFLDTDSDDCANTGGGDGCVCICKSTNTWAVVINI